MIGYFLYIPVQIKYWKILKNLDRKLDLKFKVFELLKQPLYMAIGGITFFFQIMTQEIPFMPEIK